MTTKKALRIVEIFLEKKTGLRQDLSKPENDWGNDYMWRFVEMMFTSLSNEVTYLQTLKEEIAPNCKHPKKMQDVCGGQKYCMNCNMDL